MKKKPFSELVIGLACMVLGAAVYMAAGSLQQVKLGIGPGGFPRFIGVVLAALGIAQTAMAVRSGVFIGIVPGTGGAIAVFIAYNVAQKISKHPEKFGHGSFEGIAAPEASNNGTTGGALIPMLCLGIPGDTVTSVMLGALTLIGVTPGPQLFTQSADIVYAIFAGMIVIQFVMLLFGVLFARVAPRVLKVPVRYLMPIILVLCIVGAFCLANQTYHVAVAIAFGFIGYYMKKFSFPGAPMVLGVILGPIAEKNLDRALQLSRNNWTIFFRCPIALTFILLSVGMIAWTIIGNIRDAKKTQNA